MPPCPSCGKEVPTTGAFCPFCGTSLHPVAGPSTSAGSYQPPYYPHPGMMDDRMERVLKRLERVTYIVAAEAIILLIFIILTFIP